MAKRPALGLAIEDTRVVLASVSADGKTLERYGSKALPPNVVNKGDIINKDILAKTISELMAEVKPHSVRVGEAVVLGLGGDKVIMQTFTVPALPQKRIEEAIKWRAKSLSPVYENDVVSDWRIIGASDDDQVEVMWMAVRKGVIENYIEVIGSAGLVVREVQPAVFGIVRSIDKTQVREGNRLVIHIGAGQVEMILLVNGAVRFSNLLRASEIQAQGGWVRVIQNMMNYVGSKYRGIKIGEIILTGEVEVDSVYRQLGGLGIKVVGAKAEINNSRVPGVSLISQVIGLVIDGDEKEKRVSLMPENLVQMEELGSMQNIWLSGSMAILVITGVLVGGLWWWRGNLSKSISDNQVAIVETDSLLSISDDDGLRSQVKEFNELVTETTFAVNAGGMEAETLEQLAAAIPSGGVRLTSFLVERGTSSGAGLMESEPQWSLNGIANSREQVLSYYDRLIEQERFSKGRLYFGSLDKNQSVEFRIANSNER